MRSIIRTFAVVAALALVAGPWHATAEARPRGGAQPEDLTKLYKLEFETKRVDDWPASGLTALGEGRIGILVGISDGGCIEKEAVTVKSVEVKDGVTVLDILYALDGQPCKALFQRQMKATLTPPKPGAYKVRLWIDERYHGQGQVLRWEKDVTI